MSRPPDEPAACASDDALVARAKAGDADAYAVLVARHQRMVHALAYRLTGSAADAADLAQDTFVRAWRQLASFRGDSTMATWLRCITVHACLNWRRATDNRRRLHETWSGQHRAEMKADEGAAVTARVDEALRKLAPSVRAAVVLTVYEGLGHAEAARVLGCAETTVSWRVWVARRHLKRWLADLAPRKGEHP